MSKTIGQKLLQGYFKVSENMNKDSRLSATRTRVIDRKHYAIFVQAIKKDDFGFLPGDRVYYTQKSLKVPYAPKL